MRAVVVRVIVAVTLLAAAGCSVLFNGSDLHGTGNDGGAGSGGGGGGGGDDMASSGDDMAGGGSTDMAQMGPLTLGFTKSSPVAVGDAPYAIVAGDFDGDGKLDLATANDNGGNVTVLFGDGAGSFTSVNVTPSGVPANCSPYAIAAANFDGQGPIDIVMTCTDLGNVNGGLVLLGSSTRTFTQKPITNLDSSTANLKPEAVVGGDFNHDGKVDIAVAYAGADQVAIFPGNGDGTFGAAATHTLTAGAEPRSVKAADLNNDGRDDLVVGNNGLSTIAVFIQTAGSALPTSGTIYNVGNAPAAIGIGDVDGDARPDLVVANETDNTVSVLINKGDGTFPTAAGSNVPPSYNPGSYTFSIALADFNRDGKLDLVTGAGTQNIVSVMLGDGKGGFGGTQQPDCGQISDDLVAGNFNADTLPDIACANNTTSGSTVTLLLNSSH